MKAKNWWTIQSFFSCFLWNGVLIAFLFVVSLQMLQGYQQWTNGLLTSADGAIPEHINAGLLELKNLLNQTEQYLAPVVLGSGALFTLILWLFLLLQGRGLARRATSEPAVKVEKSPSKAERPQDKETGQAAAAARAVDTPPTPQAAIQILSILQREGRFIDFLQEDLSVYDDAQIGAAVRSIHQGCKNALVSHLELKPIFDGEEGSEVAVPANFDPNAIRLTGNVVGAPPFSGALKHRGWQAVKVDLPVLSRKDKDHWIIAPAEVEIGG